MHQNIRDGLKLYRYKLPDTIPLSDGQILQRAKLILEQRFTRSNFLTSPTATKEYLKSMLAEEPKEVFVVIYLDNQHGVLDYEIVFQGTIDGAAIYPREVVKKVLDRNSAAVIFAHNHPSGTPEPSTADEKITKRLIEALSTVDVRVLDHFIVGGTQIVSFAELGLI